MKPSTTLNLRGRMCSTGNHCAGLIGSALVRVNDWDAGLAAFVAKIDDFNIRGQRDQVEHPGFLTKFKFCTECGADLSGVPLAELWWTS